MPTRVAYAGTAAAGDVYTAANHARMPGGWIGYVEVVANQTGISTETALTSLTLTVTTNTSRRIEVSGFVGSFSGTTAADVPELRIKEGATILQKRRAGAISGGEASGGIISVVLTPSAGSHTYNLALIRTGTGTVGIAAAADSPAYIMVEDIGPAT